MTEDRVDAIIRLLDVPAGADPDFVRSTYAALLPRAQAARATDGRTIARLWRELRLLGAGPLAPSTPGSYGALRSSRRLYLLAVIAVAVALLGAAALAAGFGQRLFAPISVGRNGFIAYADTASPTDNTRSVHLVRGDGSAGRIVGTGICPTFSANGRVLAYWSDPDPAFGGAPTQLTVASADGSSVHVVPGVRYDLGDGGRPAVSRDGSRILQVGAHDVPNGTRVGYGTPTGSPQELWVAPLDGGPPTRLVAALPNSAEVSSKVAWSPRGRQIAIAASTPVINGNNSGSYRSSIYLVDADGSNLRRLTSRPGTDFISMSWSPDGRYLAYLGLPDGSPLPSLGTGTGPPDSFYPPLDVFVINADGSGDRDVTNTTGNINQVAWSPDGTRLAYLVDVGASLRVATVRMNGGTPVGPRVLGAATDVQDVVWSPDASRILGYSADQAALVSIDAALQEAQTRLAARNGDVFDFCGPSWQRLGP